MGAVRVGAFPPSAQLPGAGAQRDATLARIADQGIDHACVGDHVSFFVGVGVDGLIAATSLLTVYDKLPVYIGLYLLPLRHPLAGPLTFNIHQLSVGTQPDLLVVAYTAPPDSASRAALRSLLE